MINWQKLDLASQLDEIDSISKTQPVVIFKHSTTCGISNMAKLRLEADWDLTIPAYYLDLHKFKSLSSMVAKRYNVYHESPQLILVIDGVSDYDSSHFDITLKELKESMTYLKVPS